MPEDTTAPAAFTPGPRYEYTAIEGLTMDQLNRLGHAGWKLVATKNIDFRADGTVLTWGLAIHTL